MIVCWLVGTVAVGTVIRESVSRGRVLLMHAAGFDQSSCAIRALVCDVSCAMRIRDCRWGFPHIESHSTTGYNLASQCPNFVMSGQDPTTSCRYLCRLGQISMENMQNDKSSYWEILHAVHVMLSGRY